MTSQDVIQASVATHNRRAGRVGRDMQPIACVMVGTVMAILAACALVHWATPCADAHLCLGLLALPRRAAAHCGTALAGTWLHRAWLWPRRTWLSLRIKWAEQEVDELVRRLLDPSLDRHTQRQIERQLESHRLWIAAREVQLLDLEMASSPIVNYGGTQ